jgi:GTP-binding protein EngB required for normal cell division
MSPLLMGSKRVTAPSLEALAAQAGALGEAVDAGDQQLDPAGVAEARRVIGKVRERTAIAGSHTVVALAGATGSGKSSLFNAISGAQLATIGARRPTTSTPTAAVWGEESAGPLLDWLGVEQRHSVDSVPDASSDGGRRGAVGSLDGLVLLDLPDFDSRELSHRVEAERVLALCDVFVWVTDPQKYADALLHDGYVRQLSGHDAVMLAVLNQSDRLSPEAVRECGEDLAGLLKADGITNVQIITTSARTGDGVPELRQRLANAVAGHHAARQRLSADVTAVARALRRGVADAEPKIEETADGRLVEALGRAAGVPVVLNAVQEDYRREAVARSGWLFTRWGRSFKPDPLKRLRLDKTSSVLGQVDESDVRAVLGRSSIPAPTPAARSAVRLAVRQLADRAGSGLPVPWSEAVSDATEPDVERLDEALDRAIVATSLRGRNPLWWRVMGLLQWLLGVAAVLGLVWLVVLGVVGWLQLPEIDTPRLGPLPYPFLLLVGGLLLGALCAGLARLLGQAGARRRRQAISGRLNEAIETVATERLVKPVRLVLARHRTTRTKLDAARKT